MAKATFAAGCFWGVEEAFRHVEGVTATTVGYTGGTKKSPSYKDVCTGNTGHAEAVEVAFDPALVSYPELLAAFWQSHDPTRSTGKGRMLAHSIAQQSSTMTPSKKRLRVTQKLHSRNRALSNAPS
jgi:methionine-S-sulfoxide reductase